MVPFGLLLVSLLVFRGLGALGVEPLSDWQNAAAGALALVFLFTASAHFTRTKNDLISMVPDVFPRPELLASVTGVPGMFQGYWEPLVCWYPPPEASRVPASS